ncbi:kinase [Thalictrum thalictroides]|uniref:mitogen-activated protein kinase kinase kinase n=1 Tax=Thalictrum thalictroides TaxID=46969 RepID=A0A7J6X8N6_THATH|nr:kinase [Thalictrum thalictroides]
MDFKPKRSIKPKLDRRNAIKNIDYEPPSSSTFASTSTTTSVSSSVEDFPSLRSRSLDLSPYGQNQKSFRIEGIDGEMDRICWSLGLNGPEDFAIPTAAWEASKARSSSEVIFPRSRLLQQLDYCPLNDNEEEAVKETSVLTRIETRVKDIGESVLVNENVFRSVVVGGGSNGDKDGSKGCHRGGIKGVRPPLLAPPPLVALPSLGSSGSTWDILKSFAPEYHDSRGSSSSLKGRVSTSSSDESKEASSDEDEAEGMVGVIIEREEVDGVRIGETTILSESCSFSTSNDDDSSSTTTDPMYIISPNVRFRRNIKSWTKGTLLGSGSFGTVYEGFSDDGFFFAVKEVSLLDQGNQAKQSIYQLEQEISLLSQFEHENIVQYLGTEKDEEKLYIFLELVTKGSLAQLYQKYHLHDSQVSAYTRQILHGLAYLHDRDVVHRDIKCANILVDANGSVKLADFGLAKATKFNDVKSCKGTAFWMAPEVVNNKSRGYGLAADIWSLGCTVLEMLTRQLPYSHLECMQALFKIGKGEPPRVPNSLSRTAKDFILQCLRVNADDRPTAAQLLEHAFVKRPLSATSGSVSPSHPNWRRS